MDPTTTIWGRPLTVSPQAYLRDQRLKCAKQKPHLSKREKHFWLVHSVVLFRRSRFRPQEEEEEEDDASTNPLVAGLR
jgi:hypothetical protein